jgi:excisionase family DNA binding protein
MNDEQNPATSANPEAKAAPQLPEAGSPALAHATPHDLSGAPPNIAALPVNVLAVDLDTAAQMLGVCTATIRREIDRGRLRAVKIGRVYRVRVAELHAYLKRQESA